MDLSALIKKAISLPKPVTTTSTSTSSSSSRKRSHPNSTSTRRSTSTSTTTTTTTSSSSTTLPSTETSTDLAEEPILLILEHCSRSPEEYSSAWHYLSTELFKGNVNIRLRTLDVIDALFHSSHDFREIVTASIDTIARSAGLIRVQAKGNIPNGADLLAPRVLELLALWDHVYGTRYGRLHAMKRYVSEGENIAMPNIQRHLVEMRKERERSEAVAKRKMELRTRNIIERDLAEDLHRMRQSLSTIEGCLGLLFPSPEQQVIVMDEEGFENISWEGADEENDSTGLDALAGATPFTLELHLDLSSDSPEQDAVRDCLAEAAKEAATVLLPRLLKSRQALLDVKEHIDDNQHVLDALSELDAVLRKARSLLSERCRPILAKSSTST